MAGINWDEVPYLDEKEARLKAKGASMSAGTNTAVPRADVGVDWNAVPDMYPATEPGALGPEPTYLQRKTQEVTRDTQRKLLPQVVNPTGHPMENIWTGLGSTLPSLYTAGKQGLAAFGYGDPKEARDEAREQARINAPLMNTFGGSVGAAIPEFAIGGIGGVGKKWGSQLLSNTLTGNLFELGTPEPGGYNFQDKVERGTLVGAGSDLAGRLGGFLLRPFGKTSPGSIENTRIIEGEGLPRPLASTRDDPRGGFARRMTDVMADLQVIGEPLRKRLQENAEWFTRKITKGTGTEVSNITDSTRREMERRLNTISAQFRIYGAPADQTAILLDIMKARSQVGLDLAATGSTEALKRLDDAITYLQPGHALDAKRLLERRSVATAALHDSATTAAERKAYAAIRDAYDAEFIAKNPGLEDAFKMYKEQYGNFKDVVAAADKGLGRAETLVPTNVRAATEWKGPVAKTPTERFIQAYAEQHPSSPNTVQRAGTIAMMLGAPLGMGSLGKVAGGDWDWAAAGGLTGAGSIFHGLSYKPKSKFAADMARRALTASFLTGGTETSR